MTNAERIRQMTDEELAEWLAPRMLCRECPLYADAENLRACWILNCKNAALVYLHDENEGGAEDAETD